MLWANSIDDRLMIFFLFFLENRLRHFIQFLYEIPKPLFLGKIFENIILSFYPVC